MVVEKERRKRERLECSLWWLLEEGEREGNESTLRGKDGEKLSFDFFPSSPW